MALSLSNVYVHIVFSTKHRQNLIDSTIVTRLYEYIGGICKSLECNPIKVGGFTDHVHVLCILSRKITQADLLEKIKKQSSLWIKKQGEQYNNFYWQRGYGIFSVNPSEIKIVENYIANQHEHHYRKSFQKEYVAFLNKYDIEYDDKYIWE